jgi:hypothetical protein
VQRIVLVRRSGGQPEDRALLQQRSRPRRSLVVGLEWLVRASVLAGLQIWPRAVVEAVAHGRDGYCREESPFTG